MATEVLIPMGTFKAYALQDMTSGRLIKWSQVPEHITYTDSGERPVGMVIADVNRDEIVSQYGAVEFFKTSGIVRTPLDFLHVAGTEVESGADGTIQAVTTGYAFGQVLTSGNAGDDAEIYIY